MRDRETYLTLPEHRRRADDLGCVEVGPFGAIEIAEISDLGGELPADVVPQPLQLFAVRRTESCALLVELLLFCRCRAPLRLQFAPDSFNRVGLGDELGHLLLKLREQRVARSVSIPQPLAGA